MEPENVMSNLLKKLNQSKIMKVTINIWSSYQFLKFLGLSKYGSSEIK